MTHPLDKIKSGIKICAQMSPESTEEDFQFVTQMGVEYAVLWTNASRASAEYYRRQRDRFAEHGIEVFGFMELIIGTRASQYKVRDFERSTSIGTERITKFYDRSVGVIMTGLGIAF